jgi:hypothetical protein
MATYQTLIDLALQQALAGGDQLRSALLDADMTMESLVQQVFQQVALRYAGGDSDSQSLLRATHTVALTNGVGTLPDEALTSCIWGSSVDVDGEPLIGPAMSYIPWISFTQPSDNLLGYYSVRGNTEFYWIDPNETYTPGAGRTGNVEVTIASVPLVPASASDPVDVPSECFSDLVTALAVAISSVIARQQKAA